MTESKSKLYTDQIEKGISGSKPGWVRLSFYYFIPEEEFNYIIKAIIWISEHGWKLLNHYDFNCQTGQWVNNSSKSQVEVSLDDFLTDRPSLKKGSSEDRRLSWKANFIFADTLAKESREKRVETNVHTETQWFPLSKDLDSEDMTKPLKIFSPWRSISRKISTMSKA